jgi:hypothetical protein
MRGAIEYRSAVRKMWKHQMHQSEAEAEAKDQVSACKGTAFCVGPWQSCLDSNTMIGANGEHVPVGHPLMTTITGTWCRHILFTQIDFPSGAKCLSTVRFASVPFSLPVLDFFRFPSVSLSLVMQMQNLLFMH